MAAPVSSSTFALYSAAPDSAALAAIPNASLFDHDGRMVLDDETKIAFHDKCQTAFKDSVWREQQGLEWPRLYADPFEHVRLGSKARESDPRIFYFIGASRPTAAIMVSRLLLALYHPSHLFVVHVDLKADDKVLRDLQELTASHPNIHIMAARRLVQWGAWTMVLTLLDAIHSALLADLDFDFVINLSDVDVALRTNDEIVNFLRPHRGRQFVQVHQGSGEWLEKARNFTSAHVVVECGGYGFVAVNSTPIDLGGGPQCCFGRGGPVLYTNSTALHLTDARDALAADLAAARRRSADGFKGADDNADGTSGVQGGGQGGGDVEAGTDGVGIHRAGDEGGAARDGAGEEYLRTGSQWVILDRAFAKYLVRDTRAARWIRVFEHRFLSDEAFVQTVLMHSPFNKTLVNHNLRYIYWPHFDGDPTHYWARMGYSFIGGPQVINASALPGVLRSPYMFARKVDPTVDTQAVSLWDEWMARKLKGGRPDEQAVIGGRSREEHGPEHTLERRPVPGGGATTTETLAGGSAGHGKGVGGGDPLAPPRRVPRRGRPVEHITFDDGSTCDCSPLCEGLGTCCEDWPELCELGRRHTDGSLAEQPDEPPLPPCPLPSIHPRLESAPAAGSQPIRLTFVNHASHPVKLFYVPPGPAREVEMGSLRAHGPPLTFDTLDSHAWVARSWSGVTMLEVAPRGGRPSSTVDVRECDLARSSRKGSALHYGWR